MADDTTTDTTTAEATATDETSTDAAPNAEVDYKDRAAAAQKVNRDLERKLKAAQKQLDDSAEASKSDQDRAVDAARKEGAAEVLKLANSRLVDAEVRAAAASLKFRDPRDAVAQLRDELPDVSVDDSGVDSKAVKSMLDRLASEKPYLVDDGKQTTSSARDAGLGATGNDDGKVTVTPGVGRLQHAYAQSSTK